MCVCVSVFHSTYLFDQRNSFINLCLPSQFYITVSIVNAVNSSSQYESIYWIKIGKSTTDDNICVNNLFLTNKNIFMAKFCQ